MNDFDELDKVELHCHIDGILDPEMLAMLRERGNDFGVDPAELAKRYPFDSFEKWGKEYYDFLDPVLVPAAERLTSILECHIERLKAQHVSYAEIMVSRLLGTSDDLGALRDTFSRLRERVDACAGPDIEIELVVAVGRARAARLERQAAKIMALFDAGLICGVALAGDESACQVSSVKSVFEAFHARGMGIEIHAGESLPAESVWDAVRNGFPHRIGHGVSAFSDPELVDFLSKNNIHIELCPTSNLRLGVIKSVSELPVRAALAAGVQFSINTDDPGPFACSLTSELDLVARTFELTPSQLSKIGKDARRAAFAAYRTKRKN